MNLVKISGIAGSGKSRILESFSSLGGYTLHKDTEIFLQELRQGLHLIPSDRVLLLDEATKFGSNLARLTGSIVECWGEEAYELTVYYSVEG